MRLAASWIALAFLAGCGHAASDDGAPAPAATSLVMAPPNARGPVTSDHVPTMVAPPIPGDVEPPPLTMPLPEDPFHPQNPAPPGAGGGTHPPPMHTPKHGGTKL